MNINGIRTQGVANIYASNGAKRVNNADTVVSKDRVEISELGRTLSMYDNSDLKIDNTAKIAELKEKIANWMVSPIFVVTCPVVIVIESDFNIDNSAKIEELKAKIQNGTYNVDAKLTAQSIMDSIKEGRKINDK